MVRNYNLRHKSEQKLIQKRRSERINYGVNIGGQQDVNNITSAN